MGEGRRVIPWRGKIGTMAGGLSKQTQRSSMKIREAAESKPGQERNMLMTHLRCLAAATVAMLTVLAAPAVDAQPGTLFTPVDETPPSGPLDDITLRSRVVMIDLGQLDHAQAAVAEPPDPTPHTRALSVRTDTQRAAPAPGTTLTLNLFDDTVVTGIVEWTEPTFSGGYAVAGRLVDDPLGSLTLVVQR